MRETSLAWFEQYRLRGVMLISHPPPVMLNLIQHTLNEALGVAKLHGSKKRQRGRDLRLV